MDNEMNIDCLLEEKNTLEVFKKWFKETMDRIDKLFYELKDKVLKVFKKINMSKVKGKLDKDIKDKNGKIIFKKGTDNKNIIREIKSKLESLKSECNKTKGKCREGINSKDEKKALNIKSIVVGSLVTISAGTIIIAKGLTYIEKYIRSIEHDITYGVIDDIENIEEKAHKDKFDTRNEYTDKKYGKKYSDIYYNYIKARDKYFNASEDDPNKLKYRDEYDKYSDEYNKSFNDKNFKDYIEAKKKSGEMYQDDMNRKWHNMMDNIEREPMKPWKPEKKIKKEEINIDYLLDESFFDYQLSDEQTMVINELYEEIKNSLRTYKKDVYIKGDEIIIKGNTLFNRMSSVKMSDAVEGMILRKYYDVRPKVNIIVTYFKVGGAVAHDFISRKRNDNPEVDYRIGAGLTFTTSIKIKVKKSDKFKVGRVIKNLTNKDASFAYEKLSEEDITNINISNITINDIINEDSININTLLQEENKKSNKLWFETKIEEAKKIFNITKEKVLDKLDKLSKDIKCSKDVIIDGKVFIKKGTSLRDGTIKINNKLKELKKEVDGVISNCRKGISNLSENEKFKKLVNTAMTIISKIAMQVIVSLSSYKIVQAIKGN